MVATKKKSADESADKLVQEPLAEQPKDPFLKMADEEPGLNDFQKETLRKISSDYKNKQPIFMEGAFGDTSGCVGLVESISYPPDGGVLTKLYGSDYYFKGFPHNRLVEAIGLPKAMISVIPRETLARSFYLKVSLIFFFLFSRKHFWHFLRIYFFSIYDVVLKKIKPIKEDLYCQPARGLKNALSQTLKRYDIDTGGTMGVDLTYDYIGRKEPYIFFAYIVELFCVIIDYDNAYRFRFQDIIEHLKKDELRKNPVKEIRRLLMILQQRERVNWMKDKWEKLEKVLVFVLKIKLIRNFIVEFLERIELDYVKMDKHDRYFSLRRNTYDFRGLSFAERMKEKNELDKGKRLIFTAFFTLPPEIYECKKCGFGNYVACGRCHFVELEKKESATRAPTKTMKVLPDYEDA